MEWALRIAVQGLAGKLIVEPKRSRFRIGEGGASALVKFLSWDCHTYVRCIMAPIAAVRRSRTANLQGVKRCRNRSVRSRLRRQTDARPSVAQMSVGVSANVSAWSKVPRTRIPGLLSFVRRWQWEVGWRVTARRPRGRKE
jgi:hypothetical protein